MEYMISFCRERATNAMDRFLRVLSFVPADKLTWSPTPTAKSALQIAAHCAGYSGGFATIIRAGRFPSSVQEFLGPIESAIEGVTTLEQAETVLLKGIADTIAALGGVKPEQVGGTIESPLDRQTPFLFFLNLPGMHLETHTAQIEYLQTCWGDQEVHL
jgi:hypothetical protein